MADAWVAPDSRPEDAPRQPVATPRPAAPSGGPVLPVPLRPMTIPDLLDGSLRILKLAPRTVIGLAAVVSLPVQLFLGYLNRQAIEDANVAAAFDDAFSGNASTDATGGLGAGPFALGVVLDGLVLAIVAGGLAYLVAGWYAGTEHSLGAVIRVAFRRAAPLAVAWVLVHLAEAVFAIGLIVGALVPMTWFAVVSPAVVCEGIGPWRAVRRSGALTRRRFGAVLGTVLAVALVDALLGSALTGLAEVYVALGLPGAWVVTAAAGAAAGLVLTPFVAGVAVLLYLDLRVRHEGLDIELAANRRFAPAPA